MIGYVNFLLKQGRYWGLFLSLFLGKSTVAYTKADAVMVRIYSDRLKVIYPKGDGLPRKLIVENKTLIRILGRIESASGQKHISVQPNKHLFYPLDPADVGPFSFIPLVPPLQRIELKQGAKSYEIPTKR